ncbi:hypothetical protein SALBM135S_02393 [Streptomyces alboniger]
MDTEYEAELAEADARYPREHPDGNRARRRPPVPRPCRCAAASGSPRATAYGATGSPGTTRASTWRFRRELRCTPWARASSCWRVPGGLRQRGDGTDAGRSLRPLRPSLAHPGPRGGEHRDGCADREQRGHGTRHRAPISTCRSAPAATTGPTSIRSATWPGGGRGSQGDATEGTRFVTGCTMSVSWWSWLNWSTWSRPWSWPEPGHRARWSAGTAVVPSASIVSSTEIGALSWADGAAGAAGAAWAEGAAGAAAAPAASETAARSRRADVMSSKTVQPPGSHGFRGSLTREAHHL